MTHAPCQVCDDSGYYPIINNRGRQLYSIVCPECFGVAAEPAEAAADLPPASTAARIRSEAELRAHLARENPEHGGVNVLLW